MGSKYDRRTFLRVAGTSLSIGALYSVFAPLAHGAGNEVLTRTMAQLNGEAPSPFSFIQLSDTHVRVVDMPAAAIARTSPPIYADQLRLR
jgi:hypothetical protein